MGFMSTVQELATLIGLKFSSDDMRSAYERWGCNCGPAALAAVLQISLDDALSLLPDFPSRKYTSPTMMKDALLDCDFREITRARKTAATLCPEILPDWGLVRVQWTGPWTAPGANPKWAYRQTHWFASFKPELTCPDWTIVFDVNSGPVEWSDWLKTIPAAITKQIPRADGGWFVTHLWQIDPREAGQ